ncbi:MAG: hypothetical protein ACRDRO_26025 [Pseudonocardiaceae bacterium]
MSRFDYEVALTLRTAGTPFYGLLMAAVLSSDPHNRALLRAVFPDVFDELAARENAPGGHLPGDGVPTRVTVTEVDPAGPVLRPVCPKCGQAWTELACGVVHQIIGADPDLHTYPLSRREGWYP